MACRSPAKFLLTRVIPLCLLVGVSLAGEVASAQTPAVSGVTINSPAGGDTFELSEVIVVRVTFDQNTRITGSPRLALRIGSQTRQAPWSEFSGSAGSSWIEFVYVVVAADSDADGVSVNANAIDLNGGSIKIAGGSTDAALSLGSYAITNSGGHKVDGSRETSPAVRDVFFEFVTPATPDTFVLGDLVYAIVDFDRAVSTTGSPRLALRIGQQIRQASYAYAFRTQVAFEYFVQSSDRDLDGIGVSADALTLNGGTIKVTGGTADAALDLGNHAIADSADHKVDGGREVAPQVTTASFDGRPAVGDTYELGETVAVEVEFDRPVAVTGIPQLALMIGATTRQVSFARSANVPATTVAFWYTVQSADSDPNGVGFGANALTLNGGTIKVAGGSTDAALDIGSHAIMDSGDHKVDGSLESAPTVRSVSVRRYEIWPGGTPRPPVGDTFEFGENILVLMRFDRAVRVTGTPQVALTIDAQTRQASFYSHAGGVWMWFRYVVQSTDIDTDGISVGANALTLNGGTIMRAVGTTSAVLDLSSHVITNSGDHKVDGSRETAAVRSIFYNRPASGDTFTLGEAITVRATFGRVMAVTGNPQFALKIGTQTRQASFRPPGNDAFFYPGTGVDWYLGTSVAFGYEVQAGDLDPDGLSVEAGALRLNGGTIRIRGGTTDATLTLPGYAVFSNSAGRKVDGSSGAGGPMGVRVESAGAALRVSWQAVSGASSYKVQWRVVGGAWSSSRQAETTDTQYEIGSLGTGDYEVRVFAVVEGEDGEPSTPVQGEVVGIGNQGPRVVDELPDLEIDVGETVAVNAAAVFQDAERDHLRYSASSDADLLSVRVADGVVRVRGVRPGEATVSVTAEDPAGLKATTTFQVAVGALLSMKGEGAAAPEGGTVVVALELSRPLAAPIAVRWHLAADEDASTADADMADYGERTGEVSIPAGRTSVTIEIAITDDADIEPAREHFVVQLEQPEGENVGLARNARAEAVIQEGVCDRTPAIRDELTRGWRACHWPKPPALATVRSLDLSGQNIDALRSNDLLGLRGLRRLDLSNNALATLPKGLFAGVQGLREVSVEGNPGAPFALTVELARLDAEPWAPGPAQLVARTVWAAPFTLAATLSASPTEAATDDLPATVNIEAGATKGEPFWAASNNGAQLALRTGAVPMPTTRCGDHPCFRGFQTAPGPALTLFRQPPRALPSPALEPLQGGDELRLPLASLVEAEDPLDELRWQATSSDDTLATVRIIDGSLVVAPELATAGTVEVTLIVTDTAGFSTTLRLEIRVEFHWPRSLTRGWRSTL